MIVESKKTPAEEDRNYIVRSSVLGRRVVWYRYQRFGRAMTQESHPAFTAEARFQTQANPCGICDGENGNGEGFSASSLTLIFPRHYHPTTAPHTSYRLTRCMSSEGDGTLKNTLNSTNVPEKPACQAT